MWNIKPVRRSLGLCACSLALLAAPYVVSAQQRVPAPVECEVPIGEYIYSWTCPAGCACDGVELRYNQQGEYIGGWGICRC